MFDGAFLLRPPLLAIEALGYESAPALSQLGLSRADIETGSFHLTDTLSRLIGIGQRITSDPLFALRAGSFARAEHLGLLGLLAKSSPCSKVALINFKRFYRYLPGVEVDIELLLGRTAGELELRYDPKQRSSASAPMSEYALSFLKSCALSITGWPMNLREVRFSHAPLGNIEEYERLFDAPMVFRSNTDALIIASHLSKPFLYANSALCCELQTMLSKLLETERGAHNDLPARVRKLIAAEIEYRRPDEHHIARRLHVSESTLRRWLAEHDTSFHNELDKALSELALHLLA